MLTIDHHEIPSPYTVHGIKGGGEEGRIITLAAVASAIDDALKPFDVRVNVLPATPERVLDWIEKAKATSG